MEYQDFLQALRQQYPDLAAELAGIHGLQGVFRWLGERGLALADVEILPQDEYSLDFVIPLQPGDQHLVFGIT